MRVVPFHNPARFAEHVTPMLLRNEAENNLILGLVYQLAAGGQPAESLMGAVDEGDGQPLAAAVMTPTHPLVLTRAPEQAFGLLVRHLKDANPSPPAVRGPDEPASAFADAWCAATGARQRLEATLGAYLLTRGVPPAAPAPGRFRAARDDDVDGLVAWAEDFFVETHHVGVDDPREVVTTRIREGRLWVWCDGSGQGRPVCMAGSAGKTPNGVRVNFVYTPPRHRGRGYATSCVAALSQALLDAGSKFCFLFTNLASPTPNKIYRQIGYRHVGNFLAIRFEPSGGSGDS